MCVTGICLVLSEAAATEKAPVCSKKGRVMLSPFWAVAAVHTFFHRQAPKSRLRGALFGNGPTWLRAEQGMTWCPLISTDTRIDATHCDGALIMSKQTQSVSGTKYDQFIHEELQGILEPGESVVRAALVWRGPSALVTVLLFGAIGMLLWRYYFAVATDRRIILIRVKMGFFSLRRVNFGVESIFYDQVEKMRPHGFLNQKSLGLRTNDGRSHRLRLNTAQRAVTGSGEFVLSVCDLYLQAKSTAAAA